MILLSHYEYSVSQGHVADDKQCNGNKCKRAVTLRDIEQADGELICNQQQYNPKQSSQPGQVQELCQEQACHTQETSGGLEPLQDKQFVKQENRKVLHFFQKKLLLECQQAPKDNCQDVRSESEYFLYQSFTFVRDDACHMIVVSRVCVRVLKFA